MDIAGFLNRFTPKQRITAMLVFGAVLIGLVYYSPGQPEVAVAPPPAKPPAAGGQPATPLMPDGYEPGQKLRDPFAAPPEYAPKTPTGPSAALPPPSNGGRATAAVANVMTPVLNGVVGGEGSWRAILQYGAESRSYQLRDYVGPYQIVAITADSVTVSGPGGRRVLTVGR